MAKGSDVAGYYMKVRSTARDGVPVGTILALVRRIEGWELADGRFLGSAEYPELCKVWGDNGCPRWLYVEDASLWARVKRLFGVKVESIKVGNPEYREGRLRLPDLRGRCHAEGE